jgi:hypothetical protein
VNLSTSDIDVSFSDNPYIGDPLGYCVDCLLDNRLGVNRQYADLNIVKAPDFGTIPLPPMREQTYFEYPS